MGMRDRHPHRTAFGVNLGLIITPMLDMSFQILAYFVMTYHPSALEAQVPVGLAEARPAGKPNDPLVVPAPGPDEIADTVSVIVKVGDAATGKPQKLLVKRVTEPVPQQIAGAEVTWEHALRTLERELRRLRKDADGENAQIRIEADGDLLQQYVMEVYDVCKSAGFNKIAFVPPPVLR